MSAGPDHDVDADRRLLLLTRADLAANVEEVVIRIAPTANVHACSSVSGLGIEALGQRIGAILGDAESESVGQSGPLATAVTCDAI